MYRTLVAQHLSLLQTKDHVCVTEIVNCSAHFRCVCLSLLQNILGKLTGRSGRDSDPLNFIYTPGSPAVGNTAAVAPIPFQEAIAAEAIVQTAVEMVVDSPDRLCEVHRECWKGC